MQLANRTLWTFGMMTTLGALGSAQQWLLEIPGAVGADPQFSELIADMELHPDGEVVAVGWRGPGDGSRDAFVLRVGLSAQGSEGREYAPPAGVDASFADVMLEDDGTLVACGRSSTGTGINAWIAALDRDSDTILWECSPSADPASLLRVCRVADGYVAVGLVAPPPFGSDAYVVKLDLGGNVLWQRAFSIPMTDLRAHDVIPSPDGGVFVAGIVSDDPFFLHLGPTGEVLRSVRYEGMPSTHIACMASAPDGGFFIATSYWNPEHTEERTWLARLAEDGAPLWQYRYETEGGAIDQIRPTPDGGCLLVGTRGVLDDALPSALRVHADGQVAWYRYYEVSTNATHRATGVALADGGALIVTTVNGSHIVVFRVGSVGELASGCAGLDHPLLVQRSSTGYALAHLPVEVATAPEAFETLTTTPNHLTMETVLVCGDPCAPPVPYCESSPNSVGPGGAIGWLGSTSLAANDFALTATALPPSTPGVFFYGGAPIELPFADGTLCVAGPRYRLGVVTSFVTGDAFLPLDLTDLPAAAPPMVPGSRWYFQLWYRDPAGGPAGTNLSNGLDASMCP